MWFLYKTKSQYLQHGLYGKGWHFLVNECSIERGDTWDAYLVDDLHLALGFPTLFKHISHEIVW